MNIDFTSKNINASAPVSGLPGINTDRLKESVESWFINNEPEGGQKDIARARFLDCIERNATEIDLKGLGLKSLPKIKPDCIRSYYLEGNSIPEEDSKTAFNLCENTEIPPHSYDESWRTFNLSEWRKEKEPGRINITGMSGSFGVTNDGVLIRPETIFKREMDILKSRLASLLTTGAPDFNEKMLTEGSKGILERKNIPVVFRTDCRQPQDLIKKQWYSSDFGGISPMIPGNVLIASASLRGAEFYGDGNIDGLFNTYAIITDEVRAASWNENFLYNDKVKENGFEGGHFVLGFDETHVDSDKIKSSNIFIIGSEHPDTQRRLAYLINEKMDAHEKIPAVNLNEYVAHLKKHPDVNHFPEIKNYITELVKVDGKYIYQERNRNPLPENIVLREDKVG